MHDPLSTDRAGARDVVQGQSPLRQVHAAGPEEPVGPVRAARLAGEVRVRQPLPRSVIPLPVLPFREVLRGDLHAASSTSRAGPTSDACDIKFIKLVKFDVMGQSHVIIHARGCYIYSSSCR